MQTTDKPQSWGSRPVVHIEVLLKADGVSADLVSRYVALWLKDNHDILYLDDDFDRPYHTPYHPSVESICVAEFVGLPASLTYCQLSDVDLEVHPYRFIGDSSRPFREGCTFLEEGNQEREDNDGDESRSPRFSIQSLPCKPFVSLWERLIYETPIKSSLLHYITSIILFSDLKVDAEVISCSKLILLHGPPGTGKSSLCRALAQKISIRMRKRYYLTKLVEINCQSLFSKWFGGSGHLVSNFFSAIESLVSENENCFVCVFIDEIEGLTSTRQSAVNGSEPLDSMRATNAVLTSLDRLRSRPNVIFLCASNLMKAMDSAFLDRVDVKQFIPEPSTFAAYSILRTCIVELQRRGLIQQPEREGNMNAMSSEVEHTHAIGGCLLTASGNQSHAVEETGRVNIEQDVSNLAITNITGVSSRCDFIRSDHGVIDRQGHSDADMADSAESLGAYEFKVPNIHTARLDRKAYPNGIGARLLEISEQCEGLSARTLRRMPLVAHALHIQRETCSISVFLDALAQSAKDERQQKSSMQA